MQKHGADAAASCVDAAAQVEAGGVHVAKRLGRPSLECVGFVPV